MARILIEILFITYKSNGQDISCTSGNVSSIKIYQCLDRNFHITTPYLFSETFYNTKKLPILVMKFKRKKNIDHYMAYEYNDTGNCISIKIINSNGEQTQEYKRNFTKDGISVWPAIIEEFSLCYPKSILCKNDKRGNLIDRKNIDSYTGELNQYYKVKYIYY